MKYPSLIICILLPLCVSANASAWWSHDRPSGESEYDARCLLTTAAGDDAGKEKSNKGEPEEEPDCE